MGHVYKWLGGRDRATTLWENEQALRNYINKLKTFWDEENKCWMDSLKEKNNDPLDNGIFGTT